MKLKNWKRCFSKNKIKPLDRTQSLKQLPSKESEPCVRIVTPFQLNGKTIIYFKTTASWKGSL